MKVGQLVHQGQRVKPDALDQQVCQAQAGQPAAQGHRDQQDRPAIQDQLEKPAHQAQVAQQAALDQLV